jgi:hypothetical protein
MIDAVLRLPDFSAVQTNFRAIHVVVASESAVTIHGFSTGIRPHFQQLPAFFQFQSPG